MIKLFSVKDKQDGGDGGAPAAPPVRRSAAELRLQKGAVPTPPTLPLPPPLSPPPGPLPTNFPALSACCEGQIGASLLPSRPRPPGRHHKEHSGIQMLCHSRGLTGCASGAAPSSLPPSPLPPRHTSKRPHPHLSCG